jgi:hypothetical protein
MTSNDTMSKGREALVARLELVQLLAKFGTDDETKRALNIATLDARNSMRLYIAAAEQQGAPGT